MVTARKWIAVDFGGPEALRIVEVEVPDPGPGQVTVEVRAADGETSCELTRSAADLARAVGRLVSGDE